MKRLTVLLVVAGLTALLLENGLAFGQDLPPGPTTVYRSTLPGLTISGEFDLDIHINDFAPGASTPLRTHSGPRLSTVLQGEMSRMFEDGKVEIFKAGESWAEMPGEYSVTGNEGSVLARVSSALLVPKGQNPATPKPGSRPPQVRPTSIYSSTLPGITQPGEFDLVHLTLDFAPGSATPLHTHGGPGLVLVLEGEISNAVEGRPEQMVKTGQSWVEMPGEYAVVGNKGATKARVSFAVVLPKGASLTTVRPPAIPVEQPPVAPVEQPTMPIASPVETIGMPRTGTSDINTLLPVALTLGLLLVALGRIVHVLRPKHT